ncbi:MAG TPA: neutral/alkaline non-lysosomal ceramidase N-terminal domain-containing protein [Bryobacteraceae bacterium]|nr:neutral/alkaline non-lysosomal ceramidase N-terminal domain-containing protein [Bryobacteraceae bacterium]
MARESRIGSGSVVITPPLGSEMAGFDARKGLAQGVHDDLHARALVFDDGSTQVALVSVEVIGLSRAFVRRIQQEIERQTGIPSAHIILAATHTHCGPVTFHHFFNQDQPLDNVYLDQLAAGIVRSVTLALAASVPGRVRAGFVHVDGIAVNRRTSDGQPVDPAAGVILVEDVAGRPSAIAINFACHTTVLGPNTLEISADFPYYTTRYLQSVLGDDVEVLFFNGAEGDISVGHKSDLSAVGVIADFRTFEKAEELGNRLGRIVAESLASLEPEDVRLKLATEDVPLPLKTYPPMDVMTHRRERALANIRDLNEQELTPRVLEARRDGLFSRIEEYYALHYKDAEGHEPKTLAAEVNVVQIGGTAIVTFPGEVFVAIALEIRRHSPFARTMFFGLANDYIGYVPTADANANAGYEVVASRVGPAAAGILEKQTGQLLHSLANS